MTTPPSIVPALSPQLHGRRLLEALRLGVVPTGNASLTTVGRQNELEATYRDFDRVEEFGGALRAWVADYGAGKTHLLEVIQTEALERGFLCAQVVVDAEETAPSHPKRVYRALLHQLRYPKRTGGDAVGIRPLLDAATEDIDVLKAFGALDDASQRGAQSPTKRNLEEGFHLYLTPALRYWKALRDPEQLTQVRTPSGESVEEYQQVGFDLLQRWLEGHPTLSNADIDRHLRKLPGRYPKIYSLKDYRPWSRIYGYLLSGLSALARAVGYRGLVVLLDEAELYTLLSRENRDYASTLFKAWSWAAIGPEQTPFEREELNIGGSGILRELPPRYGTFPGLYLVLAMTPNDEGQQTIAQAVPGEVIGEIRPLNIDHYFELSQRVLEVYGVAFPEWEFVSKLKGPLAQVTTGLVKTSLIRSPRQAMKFIVEFLDIARCQPGEVAHLVRTLQERMDF